MRRETRAFTAFTQLRHLARSLRRRVITDAEGYPAIPGRCGRWMGAGARLANVATCPCTLTARRQGRAPA
jgi:hypothetical protein